MRLLLDTHVLVWSLADDARISPKLRDLLADRSNAVFFSAASIWEIAIKHGLGRNEFHVPPLVLDRAARDAGFVELPVHAAAAATVADLPLHHRDPFDRILVAQAIAEGLRLYSADGFLRRYGAPVTPLP